MARRGKDRLTEAEWKVMRIVWRLGRCAARDVYEDAGRRFGWAPSTVKTHLRRLVDKGFLATRAVGNSFEYRPTRGALGMLRRAADRLLENTVEGTRLPLLAYMLERSKLSAGEVDELRALLDDFEAGEDRADELDDPAGEDE